MLSNTMFFLVVSFVLVPNCIPIMAWQTGQPKATPTIQDLPDKGLDKIPLSP